MILFVRNHSTPEVLIYICLMLANIVVIMIQSPNSVWGLSFLSIIWKVHVFSREVHVETLTTSNS